MKASRYISLLLLTWLGVLTFPVLLTLDLQAQDSPFDPSHYGEAAAIQESVSCFTDRSLYITGEAIQFRADLKQQGLPEARTWSSVLYVELISSDGKQVAAGKFPLVAQTAWGQLAIPEGIPTGNYLLRSYTRWMRNQGPESFCLIPLHIINPFSPDLVPALREDTSSLLLWTPVQADTSLTFESPPSLFRQGDQISLKLRIADADLSRDLEGCLSVIPAQIRPLDQIRPMEQIRVDQEINFQLRFLPELYGPTLSGTVYANETAGQVVKDARIHITALGGDPGYYVTRSDAYGRFTLTLPDRGGKSELFIQAETQEDELTQVRIDVDFEPRFLPLSREPFRLSPEVRQLATQMTRKVQLSDMFGDPAPTVEKSRSEPGIPFYGTPDLRVDLENFVGLPTLEEVFINLVPNVFPVTRRGHTSLVIRSRNPSISLYDPLILMDGVPCFDLVSLMALPPARIRSIDVVEDVYVKGDLRFGGIINLHSVNGDMAGIDLPSHAFFIDFMALDKSAAAEEVNSSSGDRLPDTRNTLLWLPEFELGKDQATDLSFEAPDYPGEYVVLFRGSNSRGELISVETRFEVK